MINLNTSLVDEIGLADLPVDTKQKLLESFVQAVELKVGQILDERLDDKQTEEMLEIVKAEDQAKLNEWLEVNVPDYEDITKEQIAILKEDFTKNSDAFAASLDE